MSYVNLADVAIFNNWGQGQAQRNGSSYDGIFLDGLFEPNETNDGEAYKATKEKVENMRRQFKERAEHRRVLLFLKVN